MKLARRCLAAALALTATAATRGAAPALPDDTEPLVGAWTDSKRVEFTGLKTFTAQQLRSGLRFVSARIQAGAWRSCV